MASSYLDSAKSFVKKPTMSAFDKLHPRNHVCNGLMGLPLRKCYGRIACCHGRGQVKTPNGCSSPAVAEDNLIFSKSEDAFSMMDLVPCKGANRSARLIRFDAGIGIVNFLRGKSFFITGATGFLAKVLIEKILRAAPDVGKIYVLVKATSKEAAYDRLKREIVYAELFRSLQEIHGNKYQEFMLRMLIPVAGDVRKTNMGIESALAEEISEEVDVIVNSAASTTFDERYDFAMDINTIGSFRLMSFAKRFRRLKLFLQVSTAYVNGRRQGRVMENPFCMGDSIANEVVSPEFSADSIPLLDIETEIRLAFTSIKTSDDSSLIQEMKDLGLQRAKIFGWQDTYVFTKAMGEMVINSLRGDIPVVTIRPSVIESTLREPFPGWMEGSRMMDPIVLYYGKGQLTGFLADPEGVLDVVPADMVVNAMLAAMAKHGWTKEPGIHTYHIASSLVNPLVFQNLSRHLYQHFNSSPCMDSKGRPIEVPQMKLFADIDEFYTHIQSSAMLWMSSHEKTSRKLKNIYTKLVEQAKYLANIYEPYTFYSGRFDNTNTQRLMAEMSEEEKMEFGFDVGGIDWEDYISNVHIPGLRRHVMKGRGMCASNSQLVGAQV